MKKIYSLASLTLGTVALVSNFFSAPAKAATADVDIQANVPEIIFLETYDTLTYDVQPTDLAPGYTNGVIQTVNGTFDAAGTVDNALNGGASATVANGIVTITNPITLYKTWGITSTGNIVHGIANSGTAVALDSTSGNSTVSFTPTLASSTDSAPGLDYANALTGDVSFEFDFSATTESGLHTGGTITVTATAN
ncbi:hypothetical protein Ava_3161 [Trichormus variabilis ATCC 29413]|uniref:WxL domain-containing protein n=2 Tax=Anabaena variabilis TaxID=264691 RepID=Q3M8B7_TRIV2|nr:MULTISPECIES: hypothetical protein [Nostocaceae]ABA22769.1 hypothetical protein Ava_3161 [Trichormus variabilis ATCC 29413]MBC1216090.1 hypothetical protein [Trichormus variabilis ARAD]MBC1255852.1 hypothetical protein [Trichormus variabilis V5]MBC1268780.1 hypothetical protein [Trichormus variabilis FSR]MBC1304184.1 hypothetical protein [Trichormus variabilis N2B]